MFLKTSLKNGEIIRKALGEHRLFDYLIKINLIKIKMGEKSNRGSTILDECCEDIDLIFEDLIWSQRMIEKSRMYKDPIIRFGYTIYNYNAFLSNLASLKYRNYRMKGIIRKKYLQDPDNLKLKKIITLLNKIERIFNVNLIKEIGYRDTQIHERYFIEKRVLGKRNPWSRIALDILSLNFKKDKISTLNLFEHTLFNSMGRIVEKLHINYSRIFTALVIYLETE